MHEKKYKQLSGKNVVYLLELKCVLHILELLIGIQLLASLLESRCVFVFRKSKHFHLISRLYLGLREHPTTEQHGPSFNTDIFNGEIQYHNLTVHKAPAVVLNVLDN